MEAAQSSGRNRWLTAFLLGAPWLLVLRQLRFFWTLDEQYSYGWSVPVLALALFYFRWRDRPAPDPASGRAAWGILLLAALVWVPLRLVQEASPDWSMIHWLLALAALSGTLALLEIAGGRRWMRWFAFPFAFLLTAVPWPQRLELAITGSLMRWGAVWSVEVLGWLGVPALATGNLIQLSHGVLGVDEACSGVRSLQALLMVTLFLGEMYRFSWRRRLGLCLAGLLLTLAGNFLRTLTLAIVAARGGLATVEGWHDPAGFTVLTFALVGTWLLALWMRGGAPVHTPLSPAMQPFRALPVAAGMMLLVWFVLVEGGVEYWYRRHESARREWAWSVRWPVEQGNYRPLEVPGRARRILLCDHAQGASWREPDGSRWILYWLRWEPGRTASQSARMHRPETCLPAAGAVLQQDHGVRLVQVGSLALPFHLLTFAEGGHSMHVFFCLDEQVNRAARTPLLPSDAGRLQWVRAGQRNLGQQSLEVALVGYPSTEAAVQAFAGRFAQIVTPSH